MKKLRLTGLSNAKKLERKELKTVLGGVGSGCTDVCKPNDGYCEQYGLQCTLWIWTYPNGEISIYCTKCV